MEITSKLVLGFSSAMCLLTVALVSNATLTPSRVVNNAMPTLSEIKADLKPENVDMSGFSIGLGAGYQSYKYEMTQTDSTGLNTIFVNQAPSLNTVGMLGQMGYTYIFDRMVLGFAGQFEYDNLRSFNGSAALISDAIVVFRSHINVSVLGGYKANAMNLIYLEVGYSSLMTNSILRISTPPGEPQILEHSLNGNFFGIGWRHYFMNRFFIDLDYDFIYYAKSLTGISIPTTATLARQSMSELDRTTVNGITATINYVFK